MPALTDFIGEPIPQNSLSDARAGEGLAVETPAMFSMKKSQ